MSVNRYLLGAHVLAGYAGDDIVDAGEDLSDLPESELAARALLDVQATLAQEMTSLPNHEGGRTVDGGGGQPGAFAPPARPLEQVLPSEIDGVSDEDWTAWVLAMKVAEPTTVSDSGALGMFGAKPRRLEDLGLMRNVEATNARKKKRMAWTGDWVAPLSQEAFLASPSIQYRVLVASTKLYAHALADGAIAWGDDGVTTLSGALALLTRCGPKALERWRDAGSRQPSTETLYGETNGLF